MPGPLDGYLVLDLGQFLAGPYAPMILSDLGAEVIKIEPSRGDAMRMGSPFIGCQRGKLDLALDLTKPEGQEIVLKLAERADVVHHNMTRGTAEKFNIHYDKVVERNPEIVYCRTYAYGIEGPMSISGGIDPLYQATLGLEYEAGGVLHGNPPMYLRFGMADTANAFASVIGVLTALLHKERTGEGQSTWTSLLNGAAMFMSDVALLADGTPAPQRPRMDKELTGLSPCYRLYETQEGWIQVAAVTLEQWKILCATLGVGHLGDDPELTTFDDRAALKGRVSPILERAFKERTALVWQEILDVAGVPVEVSVNTYGGQTFLHDADNRRLGLVAEYEHPLMGHLSQFGDLMNFSRTPTGPYGPPPLVGEHSRIVLTRFGWTDSEVDDLIARGIVYQTGPDAPYPWML